MSSRITYVIVLVSLIALLTGCAGSLDSKVKPGSEQSGLSGILSAAFSGAGGSALYASKSMDAESVETVCEKAKASLEKLNMQLYLENKYKTYSNSDKSTPKSNNGVPSPNPEDRFTEGNDDTDPGVLYVVYRNSLIESGEY